MNRITRAVTTSALAAALAWPAGGTAAAQDRTFEWDGRLEAGQTLEVKGINGSVAARSASGRTASVEAEIDGNGDDPSSVRIEVVEHDEGVTVCAVYPGEETECAPGDRASLDGDGPDRVVVDFDVRVPDGVHFRGHTVNGGVTARELGGDVTAGTVNGAIEVETAGSATARTVNGSIHARVGELPESGSLRFRTVNGTITLTLPEGAGARVRARTQNGGISTDFPLTVQGRFGSRSLEGTIGGGGPELELETVNGTISLRRAG